jgi:ankyrin repeat protein
VHNGRHEYWSKKRGWAKRRYPHTILTHAICQGDSEYIRIILEDIDRGNIYPTIVDHVCSDGRTALWHACNQGDFDLVRELVEYGYANINKCGILIVAAQNGYEKIIDYLLSRGCDPNRRAKNYNERALHAASRRNHLDIVNALLKHGADPLIRDYQGRTALDYAIHKRHIEIAKVLIHHQGGHFVMNQMGFTPLMLATYCGNTPIVDILLGILPHQQILDELTLLACKYTIDGAVSKRNQAYCYFEMALSMPTSLCNSEPCEAYEFLSECQTLNQLALIRENDNAMRMHALLVSERLLLQSGEVNHLVSLIIKQSNFYKWHGIFHRCLQLRLHAYRLVIQMEHDDWRAWHDSKWHTKYLDTLMELLLDILQQEGTVPVESLVLIWTWILKRVNNVLDESIFKLLCIITHVSIL